MRLPDFIFGRNEDREAAVGLRLAGVIITDFPKPEAQLSVAEWREIQDFVDELVAAAGRDDSNLHEAGFWREVPPPDRFVPPFPEEIVRQRMVGHLVLTFDVAGDGMVYVTGSECAATREEVDAGIRRSMH
jgi:hypothetical protein